MEIKIGRKVNGSMDYKVPDQYVKVSKEHALLRYENEHFEIKDLDSSNGTYVNGKRIASKKISINDKVFLGDKDGEESFHLDLKKLLSDFEKIKHENRVDFSNEFKSLVYVYQNYHSDLASLRRKNQLKSQAPKIMVSILIGAILIIAVVLDLIPKEFQKFQYPVIMIVMAVVGVLSFTSKPVNILDAQTELELKYQIKYACPKCNKPFSLNTHWKKLKSNRKCPHNCGAEF